MANRAILVAPLFVALALLLPGCVGPYKAYEGPTLPASKISIVEGLYAYSTTLRSRADLTHEHTITVEEIDGEENSRAKYGSAYQVSPGQHIAKVRYDHKFLGSVNLTVKFTSEAGHRYIIAATRRGWRSYIWVVDITKDGLYFVKRGKVIAGEMPPS